MELVKLFIKEFALYFIWVPLRQILYLLPLKAIYVLAAIVARCFYVLAPKKRKMVAQHLALLLDGNKEREIKELTRRSFDNYVKMQIENLLLGRLSKDLVRRMVSVEGIENLDIALKKGKGAIILKAHFGSFLMALPALGFMGYRVNQITRPPVMILKIHKLIHSIKERAYGGLPVVFLRSDRSLKTAVKSLKNNEIVAIDFDGREGRKWASVKFFNHRAQFGHGFLRMAMMTGATILPVFTVRQKNNINKLIIEKQFEIRPAEDEKEFLSENIQRLAKIFEQYIAKYPCHYGIILQSMSHRAKKGFGVPLFLKER